MQSEYLFKVDPEKWEALIKLREWEYPITTLAKRTGFSKSYVSQAINGGIPVSHDFMLALIKVTGNDVSRPAEWASLFKIIKTPQRSKAFQADNYAKYDGKKPYVKYSVMEEMRMKDKAKDLIRLESSDPVPAVDFYDDIVPKRIQMKRRYGRGR